VKALAPILVIPLLLSLTPAASAQDTGTQKNQQAVEAETQSNVDILNLPPSAWAVGPRPDPVEKVYRKSKKKVWKALLKSLDKMNIPVDVTNEETGLINTKLAEFDQRSGWGNLATKPPDASKDRPIMQKIGLREGKYSMSITLGKAEGGTRVVIEVYLEERAHYLPLASPIMVERYSNGHLEQLLLEELDSHL